MESSLLDKIWSVVTIALGALVSYFMYGQRKVNDAVDVLDSRLDKVEINQAVYNKSVEHLIESFGHMQKKHDRMIEKIDKLIEK